MLVFFFRNRLPWDDILVSETSDMEIKEKKMSVPIHLLCEGIPGMLWFMKMSSRSISSM